jgi:hypothetical protein
MSLLPERIVDHGCRKKDKRDRRIRSSCGESRCIHVISTTALFDGVLAIRT